ncbi:suprabasin isoform X4 [Lepus europaeus]|uniref:suprabasin isoform X4 n=1 Tax=Lepus europaeus TaxID=9983 RepID=UPI00222ED471|nr:suprabasin isoform X5 [Oryctolagus cuniculus]XP_062032920.1 suprabasin isoform X4 [Lepus europaeus]
MRLAPVLGSCSLLLLLGALPGWAASDDPIEKVIEGINRGLSNAEREVGKALEGINNGITQAGREVEKVFNGLSSMGSQAVKEVDKGLNSGLDKGGQGGSTGQHGGAATTSVASGASVNKPFINFPALWRSVANIMP